jgi:hypothetical protein
MANGYTGHKPGDIIYVLDDDKNLKKIDCPQRKQS